ncbi:CinA-like protein [Agrobacterium tumefaciens]|nr:CinA-like protein [Agrobacterium tumefaciens]
MSNPSSTSSVVTAAMLAIGDELLSGRTKDKNIGHLADVLTMSGIDLKEVRIVADEEEAIVEALNALRSRYDYVFTSGGIGPTHDDITADAVSVAFGLPCEHDAEALRLLGDMYRVREMEFTEARKRMARMPRGAAHIANPFPSPPASSSAMSTSWPACRRCSRPCSTMSCRRCAPARKSCRRRCVRPMAKVISARR